MSQTVEQPSWYWLLPASYVLHIAEEYFGGFVDWSARVSGSGMSAGGFLASTLIGGVLIVLGIALSGRIRRQAWIPVAVASLFAVNGLTHSYMSVATWSYSPGLISGLVLWLPLGILILHRSLQNYSRAMVAKSVGFSLLIQAGISLGVRLS